MKLIWVNVFMFFTNALMPGEHAKRKKQMQCFLHMLQMDNAVTMYRSEKKNLPGVLVKEVLASENQDDLKKSI